MRFFTRKRRQPPAIIIVALIDILIVLLIFLMVTTTFKQQPALKLALPESSQAQKTGVHDDPPLVISIDNNGSLRFGTDMSPVTLEHLTEQLVEAVSKSPNVRLAISADTAAPWGKVVKVMDATKLAKVKQGNISAFMKESKQ